MKRLPYCLIALACTAATLPAAAGFPAVAETCENTGFAAVAAADCRGAFVGTLSGSTAETTYLGTAWGGNWLYAGKSDDAGSGPFTSNPEVPFNGTLAFDSPVTGAFVIGLVAEGQHSYYLFRVLGGVASVTFDSTEGVATTIQGNPERLSYAALYAPVPEPQTVALMVAGLAAVAAVARRRRSA